MISKIFPDDYTSACEIKNLCKKYFPYVTLSVLD